MVAAHNLFCLISTRVDRQRERWPGKFILLQLSYSCVSVYLDPNGELLLHPGVQSMTRWV